MDVHRYWSGPALTTEPWMGAVVRTLHPSARVTDWTDELLPRECVQWVDAHMELVNEANRLRHRGNLVRWWLLDRFGGVWLDHDVIPLVDMTLLPQPFIGGFEAYGESFVCTCVVGLPKGHRLAASMKLAIESATPSERRSVEVSGDIVAAALRGSVRIEPMPFDSLGEVWMGERPTYIHCWNTGRKDIAA